MQSLAEEGKINLTPSPRPFHHTVSDFCVHRPEYGAKILGTLQSGVKSLRGPTPKSGDHHSDWYKHQKRDKNT